MGLKVMWVAVGFFVLAAILWPLERLWPARRGQRIWREGSRTDLLYWLLGPLFTQVLNPVLLLVVVAAPLAVLGYSYSQDRLLDGFGPVARQPWWLQVLELVVLGDLILYWMHRLFHRPLLWKIHAVHHSSRHLDWLSSARMHPLNDLITRVVQAVPLLLVGFSPRMLIPYVPFLAAYVALLHTNVPWTFGPFRYVLASPVFHRWHHSSQREAIDKNFAGMFPVFDLLFGTFYMPPGRLPERLGVGGGDRVPEGILGQLAYPFRRPEK